jgi:hypothetical protein
MKKGWPQLFICLLTLALAAGLISPLSAELVTVPFTGGTAAATSVGSYSGPVWISVTGTGTISATPPINDAFYIFTDASGLEVTPVYPDPTLTPDSGILWINGAAAQSSIPGWIEAPAYNALHEYTFQVEVPSGPITFGVGDTADASDNTGSYSVWIGIPALVELAPGTLNLRSRGRWITAHIQLPTGLDPATIDRSTILLNGTVAPVAKPSCISDFNEDGVLDLMVKFPRNAVQALLVEGENVVTISGDLTDGTSFVGTTTLKAINPGKKKGNNNKNTKSNGMWNR